MSPQVLDAGGGVMERLIMSEYINREDTVKAVMAAKWVDGSDGAMAMEIVATAPVADVTPVVHGRWIESKNLDIGFWVCSNCSFTSQAIAAYKMYHYCPHCGAKMDRGADHEA